MRRLKEITELIFALFYALFLRISGKKFRRIILYYHGIDKTDVEGFRRQMAYLAQNYTVVKVSQIKTAELNGSGNLVAITFDDAFVNVLENAVPVLREYGLTACVFVPAGNLGRRSRWDIPEDCADREDILMSAEQIAELDKNGFEIFSHTLSHPRLTELDDDHLQMELAGSKQTLEEILGHPVTGISYPYGIHDTRVCKAAERAGYEIGFTIEPRLVGNSNDHLRIGRFAVSPRDSLIKFKLKACGAYQAVCLLRAIKRLFLFV